MLPENWDAVRALLATQTQWRLTPNGRLLGLDYAGARAAVHGAGLKWRKIFEPLRRMESEILRQAALRK